MRLFSLVAALWMTTAAFAQDKQLAALHESLVKLRAAGPRYETNGASPELTVAKHQLRDWIDKQLAQLDNAVDEKALAERINQELSAISVAGEKDDQNLLGSLGEVRIGGESGLLIVTTGVGIVTCQYDESAYAYKFVNGRWQRVWESEQNDYSPKKYVPQHIVAVHVWQRWKDGHEDGPPFVLTLGNEAWCTSSWHPVYYRLWRVDPSGAKPLIDASEQAWMRMDTYVVGSIAQDPRDENSPVDVLIEFTERSIDGGVHSREAIRHFLIDGDQVRRVDPVALSPRDFVDEWLTRGWNESAGWSASPVLQQWRRRLHADFVAGQFSGATMHCQTPDLWQVTLEPWNAKKNFEPEPDVYFLIRWRPPYRFTMVNVSDKPWPRCNQEDPEADQWRTLFNTQEWRW